jgi:hypothetical protein
MRRQLEFCAQASALFGAGVGLTGCLEPVSAPPAFSEESYLCDAEHTAEFDAILEQCRDAHRRDGSCTGLVSFRGTIDSQSVVLDAPTTRVVLSEPSISGTTVRREMTVWASAPYFAFRFSFVNVAMPAPEVAGGTSANSNFDFINLEARGGNYLSAWIHQVRDIKVLSPDEIAFTFSTDLLLGGHLDGCLDVLVSTP